MELCGSTAAEVAVILCVPRNTVLSRVHRGHKTLALRLLDWAPRHDRTRSLAREQQSPAASPPPPVIAAPSSTPTPGVRSVLMLALDSYLDQRLPGTAVPRAAAPDPSGLGLRLMAPAPVASAGSR